MAASMWRMNGLCRSTAGVVLLCALLFSGKVMCDDNSSFAPSTTNVTLNATVPTSVAPTDGASGIAAEDGQATKATESSVDSPIILATADRDLSQAGDSAESTAAPLDDKTPPAEAVDSPMVVPVVKCVGKEKIPESDAVKAVVNTNDCELSKRIIEGNPAAWCQLDKCNLDIFQDGNTMLMTSNDAKLSTLAEALQTKHLKDNLGVSQVETPSSSGSSVLVGILITGLLAAAAIVIGYFKCQRKPETKGAKLAEEDVENQGNTLASVAPLNPPPETQEKPSVNGESPEAGKTQTPPPTNGHSTAKTADTEL